MNENDLKKTVESIQMDSNLKARILSAALAPKKKWISRRPAKIALCFGALLFLTVGGIWGMWNMSLPNPNNQFSLVALAADKKQSIVGADATDISLVSGTDGYVGHRIKLKNGNEEEKYYLILGLKCKGENIKSITYESKLFQFARIIPMPKKEFDSLRQQSIKVSKDVLDPLKGQVQNNGSSEGGNEPIDAYPKLDVYDPASFDSILKNYWQECPLSTVFPNMKAYEDNGEIYWGYKTTGKNFTIAYEDQDDFSKQYAYKVSHIITKQELDAANQKIKDQVARGLDPTEADERYRVDFLNNISWDMDSLVDKDILTVTVHFKDGRSQQKRFRLHYNVNWELSISELK